MIPFFDLNDFIGRRVTGRSVSLLAADLAKNHEVLSKRLDGKSVLVIGGAGTIGSSFVKAALKFRPNRLYVVDINENGLTELVRDLRSSPGYHIPADLKTYPVNFSDRVFEKILKQEGPFDVVANFTAHKHVRSEKDPYSIEAMVENNVLKARRLLDLLAQNPPERFFCVSTDKAANPVNLMGASKKLMEDVIMAYSTRLPVTTARFANVAFSNGSLPAGFLERLMKRQPLSAPADVRRYFVSPEESGQICLLACLLGESGEIFFPKLDESLDMKRFSDIATALLNDLGMEPHLCDSEEEARHFQPKTNGKLHYPVFYFNSDTSGEKSFEEFYADGETVDFDRFKALGVISEVPKKSLAEIDAIFRRLESLFLEKNLTKQAIVELMQEFIPNFDHHETGKNLDQKM